MGGTRPSCFFVTDNLTDVATLSPETFDCVVVSNRLPVVWQEDAAGQPTPVATPGGLVTAMAPVVVSESAVWVGSSGRPDVAGELAEIDGMTLCPVSLADEISRGHYEGFSNQTLWPLCHDVGVAITQDPVWEESYRQVNRSFAQAVAALAAPGATVWVHDYQLMLLPAMLRALRKDLVIGYFHHIPFPSVATFQELNNSEEVLRGLLGCDLVGFQISRDSSHFCDAVETLGLAVSTDGAVVIDGRTVRVGTFPISLDFEAVSAASAKPAVEQRALAIREELGSPRSVFLGVDRIDYTKGIPERLLAFGELLDSGRINVRDTVFIQAGSPSRESVSAYQELQGLILSIVADINSRHTTSHGRPAITYAAKNLPREEMLALYRAADVLVVTALRDGMNLVVKEFVACRSDLGGVVVLSTHAGAAEEMPQALLVDPRDSRAVGAAMEQALTMTQSERRERMSALREGVRTHDVHYWSQSFLGALRGRQA